MARACTRLSVLPVMSAEFAWIRCCASVFEIGATAHRLISVSEWKDIRPPLGKQEESGCGFSACVPVPTSAVELGCSVEV